MDQGKELENKLNPSATEAGLYNALSGVGVHARDDGCLELYAGSASILIDGRTGTISINGRKINQTAEFINSLPKPQAMNVGTGAVNPSWLPRSASGDAEGEGQNPMSNPEVLSRSPLVAANPAVLSTPLVVGAPNYGQTNMTLGELLTPKPMYRPSARDKSLLKKLESILRSLG